jgi:hypothetical protein
VFPESCVTQKPIEPPSGQGRERRGIEALKRDRSSTPERRMNRELLEVRLKRAFDASPDARRVVVRQAGDLHDSGRYAETHGVELAPEHVIENLTDAPADHGLVDRWNWWIGALELAHGGYERFRIRAWEGG